MLGEIQEKSFMHCTIVLGDELAWLGKVYKYQSNRTKAQSVAARGFFGRGTGYGGWLLPPRVSDELSMNMIYCQNCHYHQV